MTISGTDFGDRNRVQADFVKLPKDTLRCTAVREGLALSQNELDVYLRLGRSLTEELLRKLLKARW